jgi:DNA-binding winged helix-turn-helix (wHTH) protein/Tfp pilus assembly protein PilF
MTPKCHIYAIQGKYNASFEILRMGALGQALEELTEFGRYRFDPYSATLHRNGRSIELNQKCSAALAYLIDHAGSIVSKDELLEAVWPEGSVEPNNVPQTIYVLRRTFKIAGDDEDIIETVPGRGYRFVPDVHRTLNVGARKFAHSVVWRRIGFATIATLVVCIAIFMVLRNERPPARQVSEDARVAYEQGRFYWSRRSLPNLKIALKRFEAAVALDPNFAQAFSGLSDTYSMMMVASSSNSDSLRYELLAKDAAARGVALDDTCGECHASLAFVNENRGKPQFVGEEFRKAIQLDPNYATAHEWYAWYLFFWNDRKQALAEMNRAVELDPTSPIIKNALGWQLFYERQFDNALVAFIDTSTLDPNFDSAYFGIALAQEQIGHTSEALKAINRAVALNPDPEYAAERGRLCAVTHRRREADMTLARLLKQQPKPYYYLALMYDALNQRQLAERYLALAKKRNDYATWLVPYDPRVDDLRTSVN